MSPAAFDALAIATTLATATLGAAVLFRRALRGHRPGDGADSPFAIGAFRVIGAGVLVVAASVFAGIPLSMIGLRFFGWARVMYMSAVVGLPLLAVTLFALRAFGRVAATRAALVVAAVGLCAGGVGVYASCIEPNRLVVERPTFSPDAARVGSSAVRIGVLADLQTNHVGSHEQDAIDALMAERPDLIVLPGDLFQATDEEFERELPAMRALLAQLDAPLGVYFVLGDVDTPTGVRQMFEGTKIRFLKDAIVRIAAGDRVITLAGASTRFQSLDGPSGASRIARELETSPGTDDIRILLTHAPDPVLLLPNPARTDLVIAGHTHGGQVQIPGYGAPITLSAVPRAVGSGGLHRVGGATVYVSRGVGMERKQAPRLRLFCVPEVTLLTIAATAPPKR